MRVDAKAYFTTEILPCHARMYAAARAIMGTADDAKDAVQSAMLNVWESIRRGNRPENPLGYCMKALRNECINSLNQSRRMQDFDENIVDAVGINDGDDSMRLKDAERGLRELPENERRAVEMRAYGGCSSKEIAAALNVAEPNARKILSRGRQHLRNFFSK